MFRLNRCVEQPVKWILIVGAFGVGCLVYAILWWLSASSESVTLPASAAIQTDAAPTPAVAQPADASGVSQLTIATWNINYANRDLAEVSRLLRESNADVVCLQETTEFSEIWLHLMESHQQR